MDIDMLDVLVNVFRRDYPISLRIRDIQRARTGIPPIMLEKALTFLVSEKILICPDKDSYELNPDIYRDIEAHYGYGNYIRSLQEEKKKKQDYNDISFEKLNNDAKIARWQTKTFWPVFIFGIIGGVFGVISFIMQVSENKETKQGQQVNQPTIKSKADSTEIIKAKKSLEVKDEKAIL
ncbi:hypothetical protein [Labilibaculum antarcticum]|uniref:Uncharacterized protein n=1 Tax=Labilibaculum antarcticum TaxID=1717717 RepID=A0A1Y1CNG3_9BACT|nr:hypothetical protein [Labilibaculum antarcticum]BAX81978.1 hypothetical protein ALGA_3686 [Labilibaculum antarcticum]